MANLTLAHLRRIMPRLPEDKAAEYFPHLTAAMAEFGIDTPQRAAIFLAQLAHESSELRRWEEGLNYSAKALIRTWPSRFKGAEGAVQAELLARNPEAIASFVYANRMGNGPAETRDGWRFRGRGPLQRTGRAAYREDGEALGLPLEDEPDLMLLPEVGFRVAGLYWQSNGLNRWAALGSEAGLLAVSRAINLGNARSTRMPLGWAERKAYWKLAGEVLGA